jgi:putative colanic acid biosynthesis glycosyltransferase
MTAAPGESRGAVEPFFTVVTVVLNDEPGFRDTMASLHGQTWRDHEWVVVDGASRDGTPALLASGSTGATRWISERDGGVYDAMQKGTVLARGRFVVYMNAGDVFSSPDVLTAVASRLAEEPEARADILFGGATLVLPNGVRRYRGPRDLARSIWRAMPANHQATYVARTRLLAAPYDTSYRIAGDYALMATLYQAGVTPSYLDRSLVDFRVGDLSSRRPWRLLAEGTRVQREILGLSLWRALGSLARRAVSIGGLRLLSSPLVARFTARRGGR